MFVPRQATTGRPKKFSYREGRTKKLCIRISEGDLSKLDRISKYYGISKTDFILMCINDEINRILRLEKERKTVKNDENR